MDNLIIGSVDTNASLAEFYARRLRKSLGITWKLRDYSQPSVVKDVKFLYEGDLEGKDILFVDDMISTAGSFISIAKDLKEKYKINKIYLIVGLPLLDSPAIQRLDEAYEQGFITQLISTDAIFHPKEIVEKPWFTQISVAKVFAEAIFRINTGRSLGPLLNAPEPLDN